MAQQHQHDHHHDPDFDAPEAAERTEREGEVLAGLTGAGVDALVRQADALDVDVRHVLDVGSGPGVATGLLAEGFPEAHVEAVDGSAAMVERARSRMASLGLASRVEVRQVVLPEGLVPAGDVDAVWASMVLHHLGDELDGLRRLRALLRPGGLLALVERSRLVRVFPVGDEELGRPGLWDRVDAAWDAWFDEMRARLPGATESSGYPEMLAAAGFEVVAAEELSVSMTSPLDGPAAGFAHDQVAGLPHRLEGYADPDDLAAFARLAGSWPDDVVVDAARHLFVARAVAG